MAPFTTQVVHGPATKAVASPSSVAPRNPSASAEEIASYMPPPPPACKEDKVRSYMPPPPPVPSFEGEPWPCDDAFASTINVPYCEGEPWPQDAAFPAFTTLDDAWSVAPACPNLGGEPWPVEEEEAAACVKDVPAQEPAPSALEASIFSSTCTDDAWYTPPGLCFPGEPWPEDSVATPLITMVADQAQEALVLQEPSIADAVNDEPAAQTTTTQEALVLPEPSTYTNWADEVEEEWRDQEPCPPWESWFFWPWNDPATRRRNPVPSPEKLQMMTKSPISTVGKPTHSVREPISSAKKPIPSWRKPSSSICSPKSDIIRTVEKPSPSPSWRRPAGSGTYHVPAAASITVSKKAVKKRRHPLVGALDAVSSLRTDVDSCLRKVKPMCALEEEEEEEAAAEDGFKPVVSSSTVSNKTVKKRLHPFVAAIVGALAAVSSPMSRFESCLRKVKPMCTLREEEAEDRF